MDNAHQNPDLKIESKIKEAEVYRSMGLFAESLASYEQLLSDASALDTSTKEKIQAQVQEIKERITEQEKSELRAVSAQEISIIKETLSSQENIPEILDSAFAFRELGLYTEAVAEYEKLFRLGHPPVETVLEIAKCLLRIYSPPEVTERVEEMIASQGIGKKESAQIKFRFGLEMEKRSQKSLALELYRSAKECDPTDHEITKKLDSVLASVSSGSKFKYLISRKLVSKDQIQQAEAEANKKSKSVESILMEHFRISKQDLGKSLSLFYGCPFKEYDPRLPLPPRLLSNLKKSALLDGGWIPIAAEDGQIEVLIYDPLDLNRIDQARTALNTRNVAFSVALREDIERFIRRFYEEKHTGESTTIGIEGQASQSTKAAEAGDLRGNRGEKKLGPRMPEFVYAEFSLGKRSEKEQGYRLNVVNYSKTGLGLVLEEKDSTLLGLLNPGDSIQDITLYATWAFIKVAATVRHKTKMEEGLHKGQYVIGLESREIVESSRPSS